MYTSLRSKNKDEFTRNQENMSKWSDITIGGLFFQSASIVNITLSMVV